jgi:hypothetical protein
MGFEKAKGLSLSAGEVAACVAKGLDVTQWSVSDSVPEQYDLVTVSHVLEHVPDVLEFLRSLRRWVKPLGRVYIETPDATKYAECFTSICQGFNSEHINHFSEAHLLEALYGARFARERSGTYIMPIERTDSTYPCVWALVSPRAASMHWLKTSIETYRDRLIPQLHHVASSLQRSISGPIAMWGMGETARMLIEGGVIDPELVLLGCDTNPVYHNRIVHNIPVYDPEHFNPPPEVPILICSQTRKDEIYARIRELGLSNRTITLED